MTTNKNHIYDYIWKKFDRTRFEPLTTIFYGNEPIVLMHEKDKSSLKPWYVEYCGEEQYFSTLAELDSYCIKRWHFSVTDILDKAEVAENVR